MRYYRQSVVSASYGSARAALRSGADERGSPILERRSSRGGFRAKSWCRLAVEGRWHCPPAYGDDMTDTGPGLTPDRDSVNERAHLLPEELAVGSADPQEQAEVILEESAERTDDPGGTQEDSAQVP